MAMASGVASESYEVAVESPEFKFCSAHFTAFSGFREKLHGHNYTVKVRVLGQVNSDGYVVDFGDLKKILRAECKALHEHLLLPDRSDVIKVVREGGQLKVMCEDGSVFSFPAGDCLVLPVAHTTAEEFAAYLWERLVGGLGRSRLLARGVTQVGLAVWEGPLQSATCCRALLPAPIPEAMPTAEVPCHSAPCHEAPALAQERTASGAGATMKQLPRVALVTGASRGYGQALALALLREARKARRSVHLLLGARGGEEALAETMRALHGLEEAERAETEKPDERGGTAGQAGEIEWSWSCWKSPEELDSQEQLEPLLQSLAHQLQRLCLQHQTPAVELVLVHNAGSLGRLSYCQNIPAKDVQLAMNVNVIQVACLTNAILQKFATEKTVRIRVVNISSLLAVTAFPTFSLYAMGKAARDMAMRCLAQDSQAQGHDVRSLSWAPGPMRSSMTGEILQTCADPDTLGNFQKMDHEDSWVPMDSSADKLMRLLAEDAYESGAHIDYFDMP